MRFSGRFVWWYLTVLLILSTATQVAAQATNRPSPVDAAALIQQAEQGDAQAQVYIGLMYATGEGVRKNEAEAVRWYRQAAEHGHAAAQFFLGSMYNSGQGVPKDEVEAIRWYRRAADQGYANAQND